MDISLLKFSEAFAMASPAVHGVRRRSAVRPNLLAGGRDHG